MTANNTWPDAETYVPLTLEMALATKPPHMASSSRLPLAATLAAAVLSKNEAQDDKTDLYVDHSPLTIPHLITLLDAFGPNISKFPLSIPALLDICCPSVVIFFF